MFRQRSAVSGQRSKETLQLSSLFSFYVSVVFSCFSILHFAQRMNNQAAPQLGFEPG